MPLASLERPSRAFPSRGAVPALAGHLLPCGFALRLSPAQRLQEIRNRFPRLVPALCRSSPPEGRPGTHEPGRRFLAALVRSPRRTRRCAARTVPFPPTLGSPVNGRHARFEALLPPGVRSAASSLPGQAEDARRCSPGVLDPSELSPPRSWVRSLAATHAGGSSPHATCTSERPAVAVAFRDLDSDARAREPEIRRYAGSIELRASPSSGDPAHQAPLERFRAPAASPVSRPAGR